MPFESDPFLQDEPVITPSSDFNMPSDSGGAKEDLSELSRSVGVNKSPKISAQPAMAPRPDPFPGFDPFSGMGGFQLPSQASAALPILGTVGGAALGYAWGGAWGAACGAATSGVIVNGLRYGAQVARGSPEPGLVRAHAIFALVAAAAAIYTGRKAYLAKSDRDAAPSTGTSKNKEMPPWLKKRT
jgi:hypothetical protein